VLPFRKNTLSFERPESSMAEPDRRQICSGAANTSHQINSHDSVFAGMLLCDLSVKLV
jgi:hypothetical protein